MAGIPGRKNGSSGKKTVGILRKKEREFWKSGEKAGKCRIPKKFHVFSRRFAKLLLRLPALRSIGLKCLEHLFFFKLIGDTPIDTFLMEMLEAPHQLS
uniref:NR LBD domain-containing protein n=1 Tax=Cyanistes caeruleus TaxID=156563 RepID=A0A8C0UHW4_CYACU